MTNRYIARQIIVDRQKKVYAYELLYRNSMDNFFPRGVSPEEASKDLISSLTMDFNTEELTQGSLAFVNFPKEVLMSDAITYLDSKAFMIEVVENAEVDEELKSRIQQLKKKGYQFVADDFTGEQNLSTINDCFSVITVDISKTSQDLQEQIIAEHGTTRRIMADKIETESEYAKALEMGFHLFQGRFFSQPTLLIRQSVGFSQGSVMGLLKETRAEDVDFDKINNIIHTDAGLTFHILKRGNTAAFAGKAQFTNPSQVTVRMGIEELQKWATVMLMKASAEEGQDEKMELALLRALFLQDLVLQKMPDLDRDDRYYAYLKGMFSVFPEKNRVEVFGVLAFKVDLELEDQITSLMQFIYDYESGHVEDVYRFMIDNKMTDRAVTEAYKKAIACIKGQL